MSTAAKLRYPFEMNWAPPAGEPFEVYPGVFWLSMPLPIALDRINLWLLKDHDERWTIVDTGMHVDSCKAVWEQVFATLFPVEAVNRIIVTHHHPDHLGLAEWLSAQADCKVYISRGEYEQYAKVRAQTPEGLLPGLTQMIKRLGGDEDTLKMFIDLGTPMKNKTLPAERCEFIDSSFRLQIGDIDWQVVPGNGHSPEHICLYAEQQKLFISGDQALPRISSNVSVDLIDGEGNPLADWLESCARLRDEVARDVLVLPAHQEPFHGLAERMQGLIDGHQRQLNSLEEALGETEEHGATAFESTQLLFNRDFEGIAQALALGETMANLRYLQASGKVRVDQDSGGVERYLTI